MNRHALVQVTIGDQTCHLGAGANRSHHEPGDDPGHRADENDEDKGCDEHRTLHEVEGVLLLGQVTQIIELELTGTWDLEFLSDQQTGTGTVGKGHGLVEHVIGRGLADGLLELIGGGHLDGGAIRLRLPRTDG